MAAADKKTIEEMLATKFAVGDTWYVVDQQWFERFCAFRRVNATTFAKVSAEAGPPPTRIVNAHLLDINDSGEVARSATEGVDFSYIHSSLWNLVSAKYGFDVAAPVKVEQVGPRKMERIKKRAWNDFRVDDVIDARDTEGKWFESQVLDVKETQILVHYNGWSSKWDTWHNKDSGALAARNTHTTGPYKHGSTSPSLSDLLARLETQRKEEQRKEEQRKEEQRKKEQRKKEGAPQRERQQEKRQDQEREEAQVPQQDLSSCQVCLSSFNSSDHIPMLLICGHSFCGACVTSLPLPITCPLCRTVTPGLSIDLKKNFALIDVLPMLFPPKLEEKCGECKTQMATVCCGTCGSLCQACATQMHAFSLMKSHAIVPIEDKAKVVVPLCADHAEKALLYCFRHSSLICLLCKDYGTHKHCEGILPIAEAADKRIQELKQIATRAHAAQKLDRHIAAIQKAHDEAKQQAAQARANLTAYFDERMQALNTCKRELLGLVNEEEQKLDTAFTEQRFELARACSLLQAVETQAKRACEGTKTQVLQTSENIVFPANIHVLPEPCFFAVGFELTLPKQNPEVRVCRKSSESQGRRPVEQIAKPK